APNRSRSGRGFGEGPLRRFGAGYRSGTPGQDLRALLLDAGRRGRPRPRDDPEDRERSRRGPDRGDQPGRRQPLRVRAPSRGRRRARGFMKTGKGTVLLVEDEKSALDLLRKILEAEGFSVLGAENGKVALDRLDETVVDVIVTDL